MYNNSNRIDVLIITPTFEEREAIIKFLPNHRHLLNPLSEFSFPFDEGFITRNGNKIIIHLVTLGQAGPHVAQSAVDRALAYWNPHYIFLVGVCGGFVNQGVSIFDFIIPTDVIGLERIKELKETQKPNPDFYHTSDNLRIAMKSYFDDHNHWKNKFKCHADGQIISSGILQATTLDKNRAITQISDLWKVYGIEMEGSGVGKAIRNRAKSTKIEWVDLRVVMDTADELSRSGLKKDINKKKAAELAGQFCFDFIESAFSPEYDSWLEEWNILREEWFNYIENEYNLIEYSGLDITVVLSATLRDMYIKRTLSSLEINDKALKEGIFQLKRKKTYIIPRLRLRRKIDDIKYKEYVMKEHLRHRVEYSNIPNLLITGEAGSGKSTYLKYLALKLIDYYEKSKNSGFIPFYVQLSYIKNQGILSFISSKIHEETRLDSSVIENWINYLLANGKAFFLLDGFDEIVDLAVSRRILNEIKKITDKHTSIPILLTSRPDMDWLIKHPLKRFQKSELSKFTIEEEIPAFLNIWFTPVRYKTDAKILKETFLEFLYDEKNADVQNLAENPLMLTVLCVIHGIRRNIPHNKSAIYQVLIRTLLDTWEGKKNIEAPNLLNSRNLRKLLEYIAYNLMVQEKIELTPKNREILVKKFWTHDFVVDEPIRMIEKSFSTLNYRPILLISQDNQSMFFHKSLMEFLTASYIINLNDTQKIWEAIRGYLHYDHWVGAIIFTFSIMENHHQVDDLMVNIREALENSQNVESKRNILFLIGEIFNQVEIAHLPTLLNITDVLIENCKEEILDLKLSSTYIKLLTQMKFKDRETEALLNKLILSVDDEDWFYEEFSRRIANKFSETELLICSIIGLTLITLDADALTLNLIKQALKNFRGDSEFIQAFGEIPIDVTPYIEKICQYGILFELKDDVIEGNYHSYAIEEMVLRIQDRVLIFYNSFYSSLIQEIDSKSLKSLYVPFLGDFILNFENLESLYIEDFSSIDTSDFSPLPNFNALPKKLKKLSISGYTITNDIWTKIPKGLEVIRLFRVNLSEYLDLSSFKSLIELTLLHVKIGPKSQIVSHPGDKLINELIKSLIDSEKLKKLNIVNSFLESFPKGITEIRSLEELNLSYNFIRSIPPAIRNLTRLEILEMSNNYLLSIPKEISYLPNLTLINFENNRLNHISSWLKRIKPSIVVKFEGNPILKDNSSS